MAPQRREAAPGEGVGPDPAKFPCLIDQVTPSLMRLVIFVGFIKSIPLSSVPLVGKDCFKLVEGTTSTTTNELVPLLPRLGFHRSLTATATQKMNGLLLRHDPNFTTRSVR